jgi:hypothetical protein
LANRKNEKEDRKKEHAKIAERQIRAAQRESTNVNDDDTKVAGCSVM